MCTSSTTSIWLSIFGVIKKLAMITYSCTVFSMYLPDASTPYANCTTGEIHLVANSSDFLPSNSTVEGRLEVCVNSAWGTVCRDQNFDSLDAGVVCRQLGGLYFEGTCT